MSKKHSGVVAAREHLISGHPLTLLESVVLFGVPDLTKIISDLRGEGFKIEKQRIAYAAALVRLNAHAELKPPANLPIREIQLTEFWIAR